MLYQLSYFRDKIFDFIAASLAAPQHSSSKLDSAFGLHNNSAVYDNDALSLKDSWAKMDSNHRRRTPADLQSAPFGHSGICPNRYVKTSFEVLRCKVTTIFLNCKRNLSFLLQSPHIHCLYCPVCRPLSLWPAAYCR